MMEKVRTAALGDLSRGHCRAMWSLPRLCQAPSPCPCRPPSLPLLYSAALPSLLCPVPLPPPSPLPPSLGRRWSPCCVVSMDCSEVGSEFATSCLFTCCSFWQVDAELQPQFHIVLHCLCSPGDPQRLCLWARGGHVVGRGHHLHPVSTQGPLGTTLLFTLMSFLFTQAVAGG